MVDFEVVAHRTALVNVDLQNCFVYRASEGTDVLAQINRVAAACRRSGSLVVDTAHVLEPDGSDMGLLGEFMPAVKRGLLARGSESAALHPDLDVLAEDVVIEKTRFGAFHGTHLERVLRGRGIDTVLIAGISTDVCCDTTVREAHARDFRVLVLSDATAVAGPNPDRVREQTLSLLGALFAQVLTVEELLARLAPA